MGMSSSQARLLTLTARMHDIEYKAQRIEAQKLQMANESRRAYESYLDALDAKKIQYKSINNDGSITFRDATLNTLENGAIPNYEGEASNKTFLLKNGFSDEIYVTPRFADEFGIIDGEKIEVGDLDSYLEENGLERTKPVYETIYETDYSTITSFNPAMNNLISEPVEGSEGTEGVWNYAGITAPVIPTPSARYSITGNLPSPRETHENTEKLSLERSQSISLDNMFIISDTGMGTNVVYNVGNIAENLYLLEAATRGYGTSDYDSNKEDRITLYENIINTYFNLNSPQVNDMSNLEIFVKKLDHILTSGDNTWLSGTLFNSIDSQDDGAALSALINNLSSFEVDPTGISNTFVSGTGLDSNATVTPEYDTVEGELNGLKLTGGIGCSKEDIIAYVAQAILTKGGWNGETLDSLLNDYSNGEGELYNLFNDVSNIDLMKIAYMASKQETLFNAFINNIVSNNTISIDDTVKPEWNNLTVEDSDFSSTNRILTDNGEQTNEYEYGYSKKDIIYQIANDILTKKNSQNENEKNILITGILSNADDITPNQWASIASYINDEDKWNLILAEFEKAAAGEPYDLSPYLDAVPTGVTVTLSETDATEPPSFTAGEAHVEAENGVYEIPNVNEIAINILVAFRKNGADISEEDEASITALIKSKLSSSGYDNRSLGEINKLVCDFLNSSASSNDQISALYSAFINGGTFTVPSTYASNYDFNVNNDIKAGEPSYGRKAVQHDTGRKTWDTSDPLYKELEKKYYMLKSLEGCTFKVIEEELCNSAEFVSNWLTLNEGYLLEFDNNLYEMVDTNVAVTTHLQEVSDEKDLKKAEAQYEADMKRIDMKDRRYDTQLAALDNERNAVKQEMETVKTVAKDNVDRTFRLFS